MRLWSRRSVGIGLLLWSLVPVDLRSQEIADPDTGPVLDSLATTIAEQYVFTERSGPVAQELTALVRAGRFRNDTTPALLAAAVTAEVRRLMEGDGHFRLIPPSPRGAGVRVRSVTQGSRGNGDLAAARDELERRAGYYFRTVHRLPGNVLAIRFEQFPRPTEAARAAASAVLELASSADAVILDLRLNYGGSEGLNQFIASHFFPGDDSFVLYRRYAREGDRTRDTRVLAELSASRTTEAPLYVLVDGGTVSAGENLAYTLQQHGRATVVGEPTRGAANSSRIFSLPGGYRVQMPVARVIHPVSGTNWEGIGVLPDLGAPDFAALDTAYAHALRTLGADVNEPSARPDVALALARLEALASTAPDPSAIWADYLGRYGAREVRIDAGRLVHQIVEPTAGATLRLLPRGGDAFLLDGLPGVETTPLRFRRGPDGRIDAIEVFSSSEGEWTVQARTGGPRPGR